MSTGGLLIRYQGFLPPAIPTKLANDVVPAFRIGIIIALQVVIWISDVNLALVDNVDEGSNRRSCTSAVGAERVSGCDTCSLVVLVVYQ